jgi:predicted trehalose synthase
VSPSETGVVDVSDSARAALADLVLAYAARRSGWDVEVGPDSEAGTGDEAGEGTGAGAGGGRGGDGDAVRVLDAEVLEPGRPGIVDVVAAYGDRVVHVPFGLRTPGEESRFIPDGDDAVLGTFGDDRGAAVAFDATRDAVVAALLLERVSGEVVQASLVRHLRDDAGSITLAMEDRIAFTVFNDVVEGPRPDLELFLALDEVGFNHLAAPLAVWRRGGRDLGVAQEYLAGASSGYALALTSVRDLYASGGPPELAGGDFGAEAHRLGTMTARMHLGLDKAFGRRAGDVGRWAVGIEETLRPLSPHILDRPDVEELLGELRALQVPSQAIRTHGDFHLGRTCRTEQGWYVVDFATGGRPTSMAGAVTEPDDDGPVYRSPLADVADILWSLEHVATSAADERDPSGRDGLVELADAWVARNRRAFLAGYLGVPGISGLVPPGREALRVLTASFELVRAAVHQARLSEN